MRRNKKRRKDNNKSKERRERSLRSELGEGRRIMVELIRRLLGVLEVPLRAFCGKARGGGGRLRHATETEDKEKRKEDILI
jgi:hypothetical protein